jgi:hypothetical protein
LKCFPICGRYEGASDDLKDLLNKYFVKILTETNWPALRPRERSSNKRNSEALPVRYNCLAIGTKSYNPLEEELKGLCKSLVVIGDAIKPRKRWAAVREGFVRRIDADLSLKT